MLTLFRNFAKSKWAIGFLAILALSLLITGGTQMDVFASLGPRHVIDAGDRSVDQAAFRADIERVRNNLQQQAGRPVTVDDMVAENIHLQYLEQQTQTLGFMAWAWDAGIRPSADLIVDQIREIPAFFNQITGQFDQEQYEQALARQNLTPAALEQEFRDQYTQTHFGSAVFAGLRAPRVFGALLAGQALETRDARWFTVTQAMVGTAPAPTDAQLTAYLSENAAQLRRPEFRVASVVLFNDAAGGAPPAVTEEQIVERFEFRRAALSQPERRTFATLTVPTQEAAARIAAALRAGQSVEQVAEANDIRPAQQDSVPQTAVADPAVGAAVFGLAPNSISDPIRGRVGFTVAQVTAVAPAAPATLESAREAIVEELRREGAQARTFERVEAYERARTDGRNLQQAAEQVGARIVQLPPFTEDGRLPDGQPMNAPPPIIESAYNLSEGGESDVIDAGQGQYFVLRLDDVVASALPALDDVRAPLAQQWTARENARRLSARAEELAARVRGGEDIAAVAQSAGATVTTRQGINQNPESQSDLGQQVLQGVFGQGRGQVFSAPQSDTAFVVGRVDAIRPAVPALAAPIAEQVRARVTQEMVTAAVQASVAAGAVKAKAKNDPERAREALGLTATAAPATPGGATTPAPAPAPARQ